LRSVLGDFEGWNKTLRTVKSVRKVVVDRRKTKVISPKHRFLYFVRRLQYLKLVCKKTSHYPNQNLKKNLIALFFGGPFF
jgi:hypothetical protein